MDILLSQRTADNTHGRDRQHRAPGRDGANSGQVLRHGRYRSPRRAPRRAWIEQLGLAALLCLAAVLACQTAWADSALEARQARAREDRAALRAQIEMNRPLFYTEATKGKRIGWQAEADWAAALASMKEAGIDIGNAMPSDF